MKPVVHRFDVGKNHSMDSRYRLFVLKADYDRLNAKYQSLLRLVVNEAKRETK